MSEGLRALFGAVMEWAGVEVWGVMGEAPGVVGEWVELRNALGV